MKIYSKEEFLSHKGRLTGQIKAGDVFIHPTDTIYGLGCNALLAESVRRLREIKQRYGKPLSIWVPGKAWIEENCIIHQSARKWIDKLPGKYTLILKLKNKLVIPQEVNLGADTVGIRIPDIWFSAIVKELGVPTVTTSVNLSGSKSMTSLEDMEPQIKERVDFIVYDGRKENSPSQIIDLTGEEARFIER